jgi:hypothetical protein
MQEVSHRPLQLAQMVFDRVRGSNASLAVSSEHFDEHRIFIKGAIFQPVFPHRAGIPPCRMVGYALREPHSSSAATASPFSEIQSGKKLEEP